MEKGKKKKKKKKRKLTLSGTKRLAVDNMALAIPLAYKGCKKYEITSPKKKTREIK